MFEIFVLAKIDPYQKRKTKVLNHTFFMNRCFLRNKNKNVERGGGEKKWENFVILKK